MAALAALCFSLTAQAQGPVVVSDKDDYSPGETALFSTTGFQPGELLDFSVAVGGDDGTWVPDVAWADVPADASGGAEVDYVVPETWLNKTLQLTVMGLSSGLMATTTFTDAPAPTTTTLSASPTPPVVDGTMVTLTATVTETSSGDPVTCGKLRIEQSTDGGTTYPIIVVEENPTDGTVSTVFDTTGLGGTSAYFRTHYIASGGMCSFSENSDAKLTLAITTGGGGNSAPEIDCLNPTVDLGQAVGCLGGGGFSHDFPVSYAVVDGMGNSKIVQATFTTPGGDVTVDVANVTDADAGDTITVGLMNGTNPVTISGPGPGSAMFSVDISASDGHMGGTDSDTCSGTANAEIVYAFSGFFPPLSGQVNCKVKQGSGLPVKFAITDCSGQSITTGDHTISVAYHCGIAPDGDPTVDDAGASNDNGINFRYDPTGMQWIYNLKTNSTYDVGATYKITAHLDDGTNHDVYINIKH
jgi:hypothetical protein